MSEIIESTIKTLPECPGVYLMHSEDDTVIYVGKAKNLKNRVTQYFRSGKNHTPKVRAMVANIHHFEYIITDSELEALVLECNLIKKYMPRYNILLKDDKHYPFIKITADKEFPKVVMTRKMEKDGAVYFGPYLNANVAKGTIELMRRIFGIYTCSKKFPENIGRERPCLYYHMKQCCGVCTGSVSANEYAEIIGNVREFLEGKHENAIKKLYVQMERAAENLEFEKAASIRDSILSLESISEKQKMIGNISKEQDYIAYAEDDGIANVQVIYVRDGKVTGRDNFGMKNTEAESVEDILSQFIQQFYSTHLSVPREIVLQTMPSEAEGLQDWLSSVKGLKVTFTIPVRGEKKKLLDMTYHNAQQAIDTVNRIKTRERKVLSELKELLKLPKLPVLIECYDISHTGGADTVCGMVSYCDAKPKKKNYKKFKIESAASSDDYGAMSEAIFRRIMRAVEQKDEKFLPLPDLILLDGGRGHVSTIRELLKNIGVNIPVFGLAKDENHKTHKLTDDVSDIEISMRSQLFKFLAGMQDEVHRFAIGYHKNLHKKNTVHSVLEEIPGIGQAKRKALLSHFKKVSAIKKAGIEELTEVPGITPKIAEEIVKFFKG